MITEITNDLWIDLESIVFLQIDKDIYQNDLRAVVSFHNQESITLNIEAIEKLKDILKSPMDSLSELYEEHRSAAAILKGADLADIIPY